MTEQAMQHFDTVETDCYDLFNYLVRSFRSGLVPIVKGSPGMGKSSVFREVAEHFNLKLIDVRLAQMEPADLNGYPSANTETGRLEFLPPSLFPLQGDPLPEGYNGWLLLLDELTNAPNMVQGAAYKVTLDRMIGQIPLHENCVIAAAGNKITDGAAALKLNTAMQSRLQHFVVKSNPSKFCDMANSKGIDHRITSFLEFRPELVNTFKADHKDQTYACERTWFMLDQYIKSAQTEAEENLNFAQDFIPIAGLLGKAPAQEFLSFADIYKDMISLKDIRKDPKGVEMPERLDVLYALSGAIANDINNKNIDDYFIFIDRMSIEFQLVIVRAACSRDPSIKQHNTISKWSITNARRLGYV